MGLKLNLGSGNQPIKEDGFVNIDRDPSVNPDILWDLERYPWPFEDNSVELVLGFHIVEHINNLVDFMTEIYRVCQHGAKVNFTAPYFSTAKAWADPFHVREINEFTFAYFDRTWRRDALKEEYYIGVLDFKLVGINYIFNEALVKGKSEEFKEFARLYYVNSVEQIEVLLEVVKEEK